MSQIHVHDHEPVVDTSGDRTGAVAFNLITVVIVLAVLGVIAWYLFTGPLRIGAGSQTNINVNPAPAPTSVNINVNPAPAQPNAPTNSNPPSNNPPPTKP
jgi:cytoskeletal protein RodZ